MGDRCSFDVSKFGGSVHYSSLGSTAYEKLQDEKVEYKPSMRDIWPACNKLFLTSNIIIKSIS